MDGETKPAGTNRKKKERGAILRGKEQDGNKRMETKINGQFEHEWTANDQLVRMGAQAVSAAHTPDSARTCGSWRYVPMSTNVVRLSANGGDGDTVKFVRWSAWNQVDRRGE